METDGGGWTLVWSYTFTNYPNFDSNANAITPRPNWNTKSGVNVPTSTTLPLSETDFNALKFSKWKDFGEEVFIKSNINNWIICSPSEGNLVKWQHGKVDCKIAKSITKHCSMGKPPNHLKRLNPCGPSFKGGNGDSHYYYFDGCKQKDFPTHDPCGKNANKGLKNVRNPHGNLFIRWRPLQRRVHCITEPLALHCIKSQWFSQEHALFQV